MTAPVCGCQSLDVLPHTDAVCLWKSGRSDSAGQVYPMFRREANHLSDFPNILLPEPEPEQTNPWSEPVRPGTKGLARDWKDACRRRRRRISLPCASMPSRWPDTTPDASVVRTDQPQPRRPSLSLVRLSPCGVTHGPGRVCIPRGRPTVRWLFNVPVRRNQRLYAGQTRIIL